MKYKNTTGNFADRTKCNTIIVLTHTECSHELPLHVPLRKNHTTRKVISQHFSSQNTALVLTGNTCYNY